MAEHWKTFVFNEIFNVSILESHFSALVNELLFHFLEEFWGFSCSLTLHTALSGKLLSDLSLLCLTNLSWYNAFSFHIV